MATTDTTKKKKVGEHDDEGDVETAVAKPVEVEAEVRLEDGNEEKRFLVEVKEVPQPGPSGVKDLGAKPKIRTKPEPSNIRTRSAARREAAKPTTTRKPDETKRNVSHFGTHSVTTNFVNETTLHIDDLEIGQNVIAECLLYNRSHPNFYLWNNEQISIHSALTGPAIERPGRFVDMQTLYNRWIHAPPAPAARIVPNPPSLVWNDPIKLDVMDINLLSDLVVGTTPKPRPIQEGLSHLMGCNHAMAALLAPTILENLTRYDTSSIWAKAFMTYSVLSDFEYREDAAHRAYRYVAPAVDPLTLVNITPDEGNLDNNFTLLANGIAAGSLVLHRRDLSHADIYALRIMSIGPQCLGSLLANAEANVAAAVDHVLFSIPTPQINWVIIQAGPALLPANQAITAAQFLGSILKVATMCASNDELVRGFVKATSISYGRMIQAHTRFISASLELGRFSWNRPWCHNPLWRFLNREPARKSSAHFVKDALALRSLTSDEVPRIMALIATLLSFSVSATFHYLNISGYALNALGGAAAAGNIASSTVITQLLRQNESRTQTIYDLMCGFVPQVTNIIVNRSCFWGSRWSDNMTSFLAADWAVAASWQGHWNWYIPYISSPLSVSGLLTSYSHLWGISQPPVSYNFHAEMRSEGPAAQRGWYTFRGTTEYEKALTSGKPYVYVPYGGLALNAALQDLQLGALWPIGYQTWTVLGSHAERGDNIMQADRLPAFLPNMRMISLGTLVTYDWQTRSLLAPYVLAADLGINWNTLRRRETVVSDNAGVVPEGAVPALETDIANFNLGDLITGSFTGMFDEDLSAAEKSVSKEEN